MKKISMLVLVLMIVAFTAQGVFADGHLKKGSAGKAVDPVKAGVHEAMEKHIQDVTCKGGECKVGVFKAEFDYLHDGVKEKDGYFVSCADFKVGDNVFDVDYFVKKEGDDFVVKKEAIHKINGEYKKEVVWEAKEKEPEMKKPVVTERKGS